MTNMSRIEIFKELIGESYSEVIAESLKETYGDLQKELELLDSRGKRTPIWDYDDELEKEEINKMLESLKVVYSWYSCSERL